MKGTQIKKFIWVSILAFIFSATLLFSYEKEIKALSLSMSESIEKSGKKTIAVVDFTDLQGNVTELGRFFAEEFSVALSSAGKKFEVVDRTHLKTLLAEHKLSATGVIDPQSARKLGQIAGVEALVTGNITPFGDSVRIAVKILDTNTAKIIGAFSADIAKTKAIEELLVKGIEGITPVTTPSPKRPATKAIQKVEANNFAFEMKQCKMSGTSITCDLLIINNDQEDRELTFREARMFDDEGVESQAQKVQLAGKSYFRIQYWGYGFQASGLLVSGIPTRASITFENVSLKAIMISLLEIECRSENGFKVQFRNIPITK